MAHFAVSAIGRDRPGIVAALTGALLEFEGNVEDSRMTILRGQFAVMLIVTLPGDDEAASATARDELATRLDDVGEELGLVAIAVTPVGDAGERGPEPTHVITVYGADHPGIVHAITAELAGRGVNVTDLQTKLAGAGEAPIYVMLLEVELGGADVAELTEALESVAEGAAVEVSIGEIASEAL